MASNKSKYRPTGAAKSPEQYRRLADQCRETATAWPLAARAQQATRSRRSDCFTGGRIDVESDPVRAGCRPCLETIIKGEVMKIAAIGGTGLIGSKVVEKLRSRHAAAGACCGNLPEKESHPSDHACKAAPHARANLRLVNSSWQSLDSHHRPVAEKPVGLVPS